MINYIMIEKVMIHEFRKFKNIEVPLGKRITVIAGKNATQKTTLLGLISQPFSLTKQDDYSKFPTLMGTRFESPMNLRFKFSPKYDKPGKHRWDLYFSDNSVYNGVYPVKSEARSDGKIRFWNAQSRAKGSGYVQLPIIFLSLKRLFPLGEDDKVNFESRDLTDQENDFFIHNYKEILIMMEEVKKPDFLLSSNKKTMISGTDKYDAYGVSAGQDNIGQILMAILSFKRLKEKFPDDYKGGLLLIDELDATLYPASQEKLYDKLNRFASDLNLQIIVTTHSMDILKCARKNIADRNTEDTKILYLRTVNDNILIDVNPTIPDMENNLKVLAEKKPLNETKIHIYCEDAIGCLFLKALLGNRQGTQNLSNIVEFIDVNIGAEQLKDLIHRKIPEFLNSLIVLDGDKTNPKKYKNVILLPIPNKKIYPEKLFYDFLWKLDETDEFWDNSISGYSKVVCFKDCNDEINPEKIKSWFLKQKDNGNWGRAASRMFNRWKKDNEDEVRRVQSEFITAYNLLAEKIGIDLILK